MFLFCISLSLSLISHILHEQISHVIYICDYYISKAIHPLDIYQCGVVSFKTQWRWLLPEPTVAACSQLVRVFNFQKWSLKSKHFGQKKWCFFTKHFIAYIHFGNDISTTKLCVVQFQPLPFHLHTHTQCVVRTEQNRKKLSMKKAIL